MHSRRNIGRPGGTSRRALLRVNHLLRDFRAEEVHAIDPALLDLPFDFQSKAVTDPSRSSRGHSLARWVGAALGSIAPRIRAREYRPVRFW